MRWFRAFCHLLLCVALSILNIINCPLSMCMHAHTHLITPGELTGAGQDGCPGPGQGGLCEAPDRARSKHPPLSHPPPHGGALQQRKPRERASPPNKHTHTHTHTQTHTHTHIHTHRHTHTHTHTHAYT